MDLRAYGSIYSWRLEMDLYQSSLPAVFADIPVTYTVAGSPLVILLDSLLESLLGGLLKACLRTMVRELRMNRSRGFHGKLLADRKL
jgi:hypothetical protein